MRCALYARFSSAELQTQKSIDDQLHECRRLAERLGAEIVAEYTDAGISAVAMANRPGVQALMAAARGRAFDLVVTDELSRLTRDGGHAWDIYSDLAALGIAIETPNEGRIDELRVGLGGTVNALERKRTGERVRRGLSGVVRQGRFPSRPPYGYRRARVYDAEGEPIRGVLEVDEAQAAIVRRCYAEILAGSTVHQIAARLNAEGVPRAGGGMWEASALNGGRATARGVLRNRLYVGEIVWNRTAQPKDRRTGKVARRIKPAAEAITAAAPQLAILERATFDAVQAELDRRAAVVATAGNAQAANRPKRLLSGLVRCGVCGGGMWTSGPGARYRCIARARKGLGACANATGADPERVEAEALAQLRRDLLHPEVIEAVVREYHGEQARRARDGVSDRARVQAALADAVRQAERILDQVAQGLPMGRTVAERLTRLEAERTRLEAELAAIEAAAEVVALHPRAAERYRALVEDLAARLTPDLAGGAEHDAARDALRRVITAVHIHPNERAETGQRRPPSSASGGWTLTLDGDLSRLFAEAEASAAGLKRARG